MKKMILKASIIAALSVKAFADGLTPFLGLSMNIGNFSNNDNSLKAESPLGIFGVMYETEYLTPYYRHISSIPNVNESVGINEIGFNVHYKINVVTVYAGSSYIHKKTTAKFYMERLSKYSKIGGLSLNYESGDIFLEYRDSKKLDLFMCGFFWKFRTEDLIK